MKKQQGTVVQNGQANSVDMEGLQHTWPLSEDNVGFEDLIIISEEDVPLPRPNVKSRTLWTLDHQDNNLYVDGQRSKRRIRN